MPFIILEPLAIFGLIAAYIWKLRALCPPCWIAIPALMIWSHIARRERPGALGFDLRALPGLLKKFGPALILVVAAMFSAGLLLHTVRPIGVLGAVFSLAVYLPWGVAQEYALNGYFFNRFTGAMPARASALLASALFCAAHLPNPFLMAVTFPLGWYATVIYRRTRNLYLLGIAHAVIGWMLFLVVPDSISHHLRVGPGWFRPY